MILGVALAAEDGGGGGHAEAEAAAARLQRGGLRAGVCTADGVTALVQGWGLGAGKALVVGAPPPPGALGWADVALDAGEERPSTDDVMRAVVQHNRRCALATPAAAAAAGQQQQHEQQQEPPLLVVGYVMRPSREEQLAAAGLLHLLPAQGVCFAPFDAAQLQRPQGHVDVLLHKASDELRALPCGGVAWNQVVLDLQDWLAARPGVCAVDPLPNTARVLDRRRLGEMLGRLRQLRLPGGAAARAPRQCLVDSFADAGLPQLLESAGLSPPFIVKPLAACGVKHSHSMALALSPGALAGLQGRLPPPAVVQEFVNHGGLQHKVYVIGDEVFATPRASIPDVHPSPRTPAGEQLLLFDSLASLPTQLPDHMAASQPGAGPPGAGTDEQQQQQQQQQQREPPDQQALEALAAFLRGQLGLTLFGFDVVVADRGDACGGGGQGCGGGDGGGASAPGGRLGPQDLVVIDVNYFPNYRGGRADTPALFRRALLQCWQRHRAAAAAGGREAA